MQSNNGEENINASKKDFRTFKHNIAIMSQFDKLPK